MVAGGDHRRNEPTGRLGTLEPLIGIAQLAVETGGRGFPAVRLTAADTGSSRLQSVEDFSSVWLDEGVRIGFIRRDVDCGRVEIVEVDRPDDLSGMPVARVTVTRSCSP